MDEPFPEEIIDLIMGHLHDDKASLSSCALVCRDWVQTSRYHKFYKFVLCDTSKPIAAWPAIAMYIRDLTLLNYSDSMDISKCTNLARLYLGNYDLSVIPISYVSQFQLLKELHLFQCHFDHPRDVAALLRSIPTLSSFLWKRIDLPYEFAISRPRNIFSGYLSNHLCIADHSRDEGSLYLNALTALPKNVQFKSIELHRWKPQIASLNIVLRNCGSSLQSFDFHSLQFSKTDDHLNQPIAINLSYNTNLRIISFPRVRPAQQQEWIFQMLLTVRSQVIEEIYIDRLYFGWSPDDFDYLRLDKLLATPRFASLKKVRVNFFGMARENELLHDETPRLRLPLTDSRGILDWSLPS